MAPPVLTSSSLLVPQRKREAKQESKLELAVKQMLSSNPELAKRARKDAQIEEKTSQDQAKNQAAEADQNMVKNAPKLMDDTIVEQQSTCYYSKKTDLREPL